MITHDAITARRAHAQAAATEALTELNRIIRHLARDETHLTAATFRLAAHATTLAQHAATLDDLDALTEGPA